MSGCLGAVTYGGLVADSTGNVVFPLPYGVWRVCASKMMGNGQYQQQKTGSWGTTGLTAPLIVTTPTTTTPYVPDLTATLGYTGTTGNKGTQPPNASTC
jgi:hypothetical protein